MILDVAHRTRAKPGESASGDAVVVRAEGMATLFAVIDALGHGAHAEEAARKAVAYLQRAPIEGVKALMSGLHKALRGSRGAAATLCLFRGGVLEGCGVGNVEVRARGTRVPAVLSPGILGSHHSALRVFTKPLAPGDRLAVFSDGVARALSLESVAAHPLDDACGRLFGELAGDDDDATLLLAEVIG